MLALRTPEWRGQREPAGEALRGAGRRLGRVVVLVASALLLMMLTVEASQASATGTGPIAAIAHVAQSAHQVARQHGGADPASAVVKPAILHDAFVVGATGHGHGLVGSCCSACSAAVVAATWSLTRNLALHFEPPPQQTPPSSVELNAQFRPPRTALRSSC